jgi:hypothetical protein
MDEELPVSGILKIIESETIYKSDRWWSAVVLLESFGRKQIVVYVWNKRNGAWKRRQKFVINNKRQWKQIESVVEKFLTKL